MLNNPKDTVFIDKKPLMMHVTSTIIQLSILPSMTIEARSLCIGSAVDVSQIVLQKTNIFEIDNVKIGSESLESSDGRKKDVSTIEILVMRTGQ